MGKILVMTSRTSARTVTSRTSASTDRRGGGGEAGQPLRTGVFGQFSLAGNRMASLLLQLAFFWREIILVTSNGIKSRKEQEILESNRGRRRREIFNENQRKAARNKARDKTFATVSFQVMFSFLIYQGRNEVYGIRDQRPEKGRDQGSQPWDLESQYVGSGSAVFFLESDFRDQIFAGSGIKILIIFGIRVQIFG